MVQSTISCNHSDCRHMGDTTETIKLLEQLPDRTIIHSTLRGALAMTTCKCSHIESPLVMTRDLFQDTIRINKQNTIAQIITIIENLKFSERTADYDAGYDDALDQAIRSITKLTAEEATA